MKPYIQHIQKRNCYTGKNINTTLYIYSKAHKHNTYFWLYTIFHKLHSSAKITTLHTSLWALYIYPNTVHNQLLTYLSKNTSIEISYNSKNIHYKTPKHSSLKTTHYTFFKITPVEMSYIHKQQHPIYNINTSLWPLYTQTQSNKNNHLSYITSVQISYNHKTLKTTIHWTEKTSKHTIHIHKHVSSTPRHFWKEFMEISVKKS